MNKPYKIGLTGGIGSGKSTIAQIFKSIGVPIFNSDECAKTLLIHNKHVVSEIIKIFGNDIATNNVIDKNKISRIVFQNKQKLQLLNQIIHPEVRLEFNKWFKQQTSHYIIQESALFFETNTHQLLDKIILVKAPITMRIKRVCTRDRRTRHEVEKIMKNQINPNQIIDQVDYIIHNDEATLLTPKIIQLNNVLTKL